MIRMKTAWTSGLHTSRIVDKISIVIRRVYGEEIPTVTTTATRIHSIFPSREKQSIVMTEGV